MNEHEAPDAAEPPAAVRRPDPGTVRLVIGGVLVMFLAPLAGFLAGTVVGDAGQTGNLDPMFAYLFAGMVVGGAGAIVAITAGLRWYSRGGFRPVPGEPQHEDR